MILCYYLFKITGYFKEKTGTAEISVLGLMLNITSYHMAVVIATLGVGER